MRKRPNTESAALRSFRVARVLRRNVRRGAIQLLIGSALIVPIAGFVIRANAAVPTETERARAAAAADARRVAVRARDVVAEAWRASAIEHDRARRSAAFAAEFDISFDLAHKIHFAAIEEQIDPTMAFSLVRAESSFRPTAVSPVGALGLTQLMPSTARWLEPGISRREILEPRTNLRIGFRYLRALIESYDGDERLALTAYNRGPGTVDSLLRRGRDPWNGYAELVLTGHSARHVALMRKKFGRRNKS